MRKMKVSILLSYLITLSSHKNRIYKLNDVKKDAKWSTSTAIIDYSNEASLFLSRNIHILIQLYFNKV